MNANAKSDAADKVTERSEKLRRLQSQADAYNDRVAVEKTLGAEASRT